MVKPINSEYETVSLSKIVTRYHELQDENEKLKNDIKFLRAFIKNILS
jgi:hypothetical protein